MPQTRLVGKSAVHRELLEGLAAVARTDIEVLITGPSGVGKELYAQFVHGHSPRAKRNLVAVNCGALPNELLENELFGHVGGAFTGARPHSDGLVAEAEGGTLFLDEIDTLQPANQVKLLRFLQEREYRRLGETRVRRANVRIIAATNIDLGSAVQEGKFRVDLFFRLRIAPFEVPALCERRDDIPVLIEYFVRVFAERYAVAPIELSELTLRRLQNYPWPGNIRELENCIHELTVRGLTRPVQPVDLKLLKWGDEYSRSEAATLMSRPFREAKDYVVQTFEKAYVERRLAESGGNIARAAAASDKHRRAFYQLMRDHGIEAAAFKPNAGGRSAD